MTSRYKAKLRDDEDDVHRRVNVLLLEKGSDLLLVWLDKHEVAKLSQGKLKI